MNDTKQLINDGGPAFPCASSMIVNGKQATVPAQGMTLRDYFAGQALAGVCSGIEVEIDKLDADGEHADHNMKMLHDCAGIRAYCYADAMLAARERKESVK